MFCVVRPQPKARLLRVENRERRFVRSICDGTAIRELVKRPRFRGTDEQLKTLASKFERVLLKLVHRVEARLARPFAQQAIGEAMDRADMRSIDAAERSQEWCTSRRRVRKRGECLEDPLSRANP